MVADLILGIVRQGGIAIGEEGLGEPHGTELQGDGLFDLIVIKTNQFKATAAEIHLQEVLEALQLRVTAKSASI